MSDRVTRFLGGSPLSVLIRLVILSILVGLLLSWLSFSPRDIVDWITGFSRWLWETAFGSIDRAWRYFALGALIVIPLFLLSRLMHGGRR